MPSTHVHRALLDPAALVRARRPSCPSAPAPAPAASPRWQPWTALVALIAGFGGAIIGAIMIGRHRRRGGREPHRPAPSVAISATVVQDAVPHRRGAALRAHRRPAAPEHFGLRPTRLWPAVGWIAARVRGLLRVHARLGRARWAIRPDDEACPSELGADKSTVALIAVAFLVSVVAPMAEEFFFRGYFYGALRNWNVLWPAALITGLVFGAIHAGSAECAFLLPLAFFGVALCLLRERTGSLYPGIALHCAEQLDRLRGLAALGLADRRAVRRARWRCIAVVGSRCASRTPVPAPARPLARPANWLELPASVRSPRHARAEHAPPSPARRGAVPPSARPGMPAAPSAAPRRRGAAAVAHARAREPRPASRWPASRGACAVGHAAVGRGPDGDRALLPRRPQAARGQRQPDACRRPASRAWPSSPSDLDARGASRSRPRTSRRPTAPQLVAKPVRVDVARAARAPGRARPGRAPAPAAPGGQGLRRRPARPLRRSAPRARCWPSARSPAWRARPSPTRGLFKALLAGKGTFKVRHPDHGKHVEADLSRQVHRAHPRRRGRAHLPGRARASRRRRRSRAASASTRRRRAPTRRGWSTRTTSSAATRSTATPRCRSSPPATAACASRSPTPISIFRWIKIGDIVDVYP